MKLKKSRRDDSQIDDLAEKMLEQNAGVLDAAKETLKKRLLEAAMRKAIAELGDADAIANRLLEDLGDDNEAVNNASEALKNRLLGDIARRSLEPLSDANAAADEALRFVDLSDDRIEEAGKAVRDRLLERVVSGAIDTMIDEEVQTSPASEAPSASANLAYEPETIEVDSPTIATPPTDSPEEPEVALDPAFHFVEDAPPDEPSSPAERIVPPLSAPDEPSLDEEYHTLRDPWEKPEEKEPEEEPDSPRWVNRVSYEDDKVRLFRNTVTERDIPCYYTYGVVSATTPDHILPDFGIESQNPPYTLQCGPVRAIVSRLTGPAFRRSDREVRFEESPLRRELKNAHVRVLEAIAASGHVVVPRPSGKFARSEEEIRRAILTRSAEFDEALRKLSGRHEWTVQLFRGESTGDGHADALDTPEGIADLKATLGDTELEGGWNGVANQEPKGVIGLLRTSAYNALKAVSEEAVLHDGEHAEEARGLVVMGAAFLVDEQREAAFRTALDSLRDRYGMFGITVDCRGPRMPLSFCQ